MMKRCISPDVYKEASGLVSEDIQESCQKWVDQINAFQVFRDESKYRESDGDSHDLAMVKSQWDSLSNIERQDFTKRVLAEEDFKT